eukprot:2578127-Amphidinium_carterae.1
MSEMWRKESCYATPCRALLAPRWFLSKWWGEVMKVPLSCTSLHQTLRLQSQQRNEYVNC